MRALLFLVAALTWSVAPAVAQKDGEGPTSPNLAFPMFTDGKTAEEVAAALGVSLATAYNDRYERRSTIVTSNLAFSEWVQVFGDEKLTTALLDRLSHHAHTLTTKGSSYRTRAENRGMKRPRETPRHLADLPTTLPQPLGAPHRQRRRLRNLPAARKTADRFPHRLGKTGKPVSHSYRSRYDY